MANKSDGSIYIDTKIDTEGFKAGSDRMKKAAQELVDAYDGVGGTAEKQMKKAATAFDNATRSAELQKKKIIDLDHQIKALSEKKIQAAAYESLSERLADVQVKAGIAKRELQELLDSGASKTSPEVSMLEAKIAALRQVNKQLQAEGIRMNQNGATTEAPDTSGLEKKKAAAIEELRRKNLKAAQAFNQMLAVEKKYDSESQKTHEIVIKLANAFKALTNHTKKFISLLGKALKQAVNFGTKLSGANKVVGKTRLGLGLMLKNALLVGGAFKLIFMAIEGLKTGMNDLVQYSDAANRTMSTLASSLTYLKHAFATAFAPILSVVSPYLQTLINYVAKAITYVGELIAALTGASTFTRAIPVYEDYAASLDNTADAAKNAANETKKLNKENDDYLSGLDEIRKWDDKDQKSSNPASGAGSGASGSDVSQYFETVDIGNGVKNLAQKIKDAWEKADFTAIGTILGTKLNNALNGINWSSIQATASKIGTSLATLINGFVRVDGLGYNIGRSIAEAINTGLVLLSSFTGSLDWGAVGRFISDGINGLCANIDWVSYFTSMGNIARGLATALNNAITPETFGNIGTTLGKVVRGVINAAYIFLTTADFSQYGVAIGTGINNAIKNIDWHKLGEDLGLVVENAIKFFSSLISTIDWGEVKQALEDFFSGVAEHVDMGKLGLTLATLFGAWLGLNFVKSIAISTLDQLGYNLAFKIASSLSTKLGESTLIATLSTGASSLLGLLGAALSTCGTALAAFGSTVVTAIIGAISTAVAAVGLAPLAIIAALIIGAILVVKNWDKIKEIGSIVVEKVKNAITGISDKIKDIGKYIPDGLKKGIETFLRLNPLTSPFMVFIDAVKKLFGINSPSTVFAEIGKYIMEGLLNGLNSLLESAKNVFGDLKSSVSNKMSEAKTAVVNKAGELAKSAKDKFTSMAGTAKNKCADIKNSIGGAFEKGAERAGKAFEGLKKTLKGAVNGIISVLNSMISGVVSAVNSVTGVLNRLRIRIPSWVPRYGGYTFGFSIPRVYAPQIPKLAAGAVIPPNQEFLAVLGDQKHGNNIETPESLLRQIVREESGGNNGGRYQFTAQINRRTLFDEIITEAKIRQMQTGTNPLTAF